MTADWKKLNDAIANANVPAIGHVYPSRWVASGAQTSSS